MKGWHFVGKKLRNGDPVPRVGKKLVWNGPLKLCSSGLHWSPEPFQALQYAPGETLCYVKVGGRTLYTEGDDKGCSSERTIIAKMDATEMLDYFARMQALSVVHPRDDPDNVLDYLMTGDGQPRWRAARHAAWYEARAAASAFAASLAASHAWAEAWAEARNDFNQLVYECFEDFL